MKVLKKIALWLLGTIFLLFLTLFIIAEFYEKEVKSIIISQLNKNLIREIHITNVDTDVHLNLIENFPKASLGFNNIWAYGNDISKKDTLFYLDNLKILFDITNLISKEFIINEIHLENGFVHIENDRNNINNYQIWETDSASNESVNLNINQLQLKHLSFVYDDQKEDLFLKNDFDNFSCSVEINDSSTNLSIDGKLQNMDLQHFQKTINTFDTDIESQIQIKKDNVLIKHCHWNILDNSFELSGNWSKQNGNIKFKTSNVKYEDIQKLISIELADQKILSNLKGKFNYSGNLTQKNKRILLQSKLTSNNTIFSNLNYTFNQINYDLNVSIPNLQSPEKSLISIQSAGLSFNENPIQFKGSLTNWSWLSVNGSSQGYLQSFTSLMDSSEFQGLSGNYEVNFEVKTSLNSFSTNLAKKITATGKIQDFQVKVNESPYHLHDFNGEFEYQKGKIELNQFKGFINQSDITLNGGISHLFDEYKVSLNTNIYSDHLDLNDLLFEDSESGDIHIPEEFQFKITTDIKHFVYNKFEAKDISGSLSYMSKQLYFFPLTMYTAGGKMVMRGKIDARNKGLLEIKSNTDFVNMNLQDIFYQMDEFGQEYITSNHLKGVTNSEIEAYIPFNLKLKPIVNDVFILGKINVKNGELINNDMMLELSDFIRVDELKHIKFSELENQIKIEKGVIYIPEMNINSSVMDVVLSGQQGFDETIDYHFEVKLNELLAKRAKKEKKENEEFGEVADDGSSIRIFLKMTGTLDEPKLKYDRRNLGRKIKEDLKNEKKVFQEAIIKEFKSFKKDKESKEKKVQEKEEKEKEETPTFELEWSDDEDW